MKTIKVGEAESAKIEKILNGRELVADYKGLTFEEAVQIERLLMGVNYTRAKRMVLENMQASKTSSPKLQIA